MLVGGNRTAAPTLVKAATTPIPPQFALIDAMFATPSGVLGPGILSLVLNVAAAGVVILSRIGDWTTCLGLPSRMIAKVVLSCVEVEFVAVRLLEVRVPVDVVEALDHAGDEA